MLKKFNGRKFNYNSRKKNYKARHGKSSAFDAGSLLNSILSAISAHKLRSAAIAVAVVAVLIAILVPAFAKPLPVIAEAPEATVTEDIDDESVDPTGEFPAPVDTRSDDYNEVDTQTVDDETLAGLTGEGLTDEETGDVSEAELKGAIGVVFDNVNTTKDTIVLQKIEKAAKAAIDAGSIGLVKYYNSKGDMNQQLQDMRSMINSNVKAIVIVVSDKETYQMMTEMAADAKIPVVAINAPLKEGYMVNILEDTTGYGKMAAGFVQQKFLTGSYLEVYDKTLEAEEQQHVNLINQAFKSNANLKSAAAAITVENKTAKIKTALEPIFKDKIAVDAVATSQGMAKNVLNVFLSQQILPKVFIGDSTAGFIKLWHKLKTEGVTVEKTSEEEANKSSKKSTKKEDTPKETVLMKMAGGEAFCSESTPYGAGGAALQFALRLGNGKKLKEGALTNDTYTYTAKVLITDSNLEQYYQTFKDQADDYVISDLTQDTDIDALFEQ